MPERGNIMSGAIRRAAISVAMVFVLTTGWLPEQRGPGGLEGGVPAAEAQGQTTAPTKAPPPTPTPLPAPPPQGAAPGGASDKGGAATTGPGQGGAGQGQGSSQPPALSAEQQQQLEARLERANRSNPVQTPADPSAVSQ